MTIPSDLGIYFVRTKKVKHITYLDVPLAAWQCDTGVHAPCPEANSGASYHNLCPIQPPLDSYDSSRPSPFLLLSSLVCTILRIQTNTTISSPSSFKSLSFLNHHVPIRTSYPPPNGSFRRQNILYHSRSVQGTNSSRN